MTETISNHHGRRICLFAVGCLIAGALGAPGSSLGADWTLKGGEVVPGELSGFDFEEKRVSFLAPGGRERIVPTEDLSAESRWRLLTSPTFSKSFPTDRWTSEQTRYLLFAISGPVLCLLVSFYICALILFKNGNPLQALAGWVGSALLGSLLMGFYLVLSSRSPGSAAGILLLGAVISAGLLSVYISIIYHKTTLEGLKILVLHVFAAFFFLMITVMAAQKITETFDFESLIKEKVMIPVGVLPKE